MPLADFDVAPPISSIFHRETKNINKDNFILGDLQFKCKYLILVLCLTELNALLMVNGAECFTSDSMMAPTNSFLF